MRESNIAILGAPLDLGAGRRGVDMGPSALRLAGLNAKLSSLGYAVDDLGNVAVEQQGLPELGLGKQAVDVVLGEAGVGEGVPDGLGLEAPRGAAGQLAEGGGADADDRGAACDAHRGECTPT